MKSGTPTILLILLLILTLWSFIQPHDMQVWWTEMTSVFLLLGILVFTYRRMAFSNTAYILISIWCAMQIIGAHYTFELVPSIPFPGFSTSSATTTTEWRISPWGLAA